MTKKMSFEYFMDNILPIIRFDVKGGKVIETRYDDGDEWGTIIEATLKLKNNKKAKIYLEYNGNENEEEYNIYLVIKNKKVLYELNMSATDKSPKKFKKVREMYSKLVFVITEELVSHNKVNYISEYV